MTDAQKDAIVKAAQNLERTWRGFGIPSSDSMALFLAAVRAAEQPRWTVHNVTPAMLCYDHVEQRLDRLDFTSLSRIARLLNEDDAKGCV